MSYEISEKIKAAYALNLCTVSISQIVDYNDVNILEQEKDTIINNLNLELMPKDEALLDVLKEIMDEINNLKMDEGDKEIVEREYQHRLKTAVWSAVPSVGAIFATSNPIAMGLTLASQVGIGYMNYRRNKSEYELGYEKSRWQIQKNRMQHLNGLQKQLFETAWRLADTYEFPDEYRLTSQQISVYNKALMETNPVKRFNTLSAMQDIFEAYPVFWYQIGSTANSIYRSELYENDDEVKFMYRAHAIMYFEKYEELNKFNLLRHDVITSSWALEYLELQDLSSQNGQNKARELIEIAEKFSGDAMDVLELCAFSYLRIRDYQNAMRLFQRLVNSNYNSIINTQILSALYIKGMRSDDKEEARNARIGYKQLPNITDSKYILQVPKDSIDLDNWNPSWKKEGNFDKSQERKRRDKQKEKEKKEEQRKIAGAFYQKQMLIVYKPNHGDVAEYFLQVLNDNRQRVGLSLPSPSKMEFKTYIKKREEIERSGSHVIMIGDSDEAKKFYKNVKNGRWDYYKAGIRFVSYGNKTVLLARRLKNDEIDDLINLALKLKERHTIKIPEDVASIKHSFLKDIYEGKIDDVSDAIVIVITTVLMSPLLVVGQILEGVCNLYQRTQNIKALKDLEFLQYNIGIYEYLDSEKAVVD